MLTELIRNHILVCSQVPRTYQRNFGDTIDWNSSTIGLRGARGVGKTTLLLQKYWTEYADPRRFLYVAADHLTVASMGLFAIASEFYGMGGEVLFIDEVHRYPDWQVHIKSIIDTYKNKKLWISGSSSLELRTTGRDLSRRVPWYDLPVLSFREYIALVTGCKFEAIKLEDIVENHVTWAQEITRQVSILKLFNDYLAHGCYPFFLEGLPTYPLKINAVVEKVISEDIPAIFNVTAGNIVILKRMLRMFASSKPFQPNIDGISRDLGISRETVYHFLDCLEKARLIHSLKPASHGGKAARKPSKIYIADPNILQTIAGEDACIADRGGLRETFFFAQFSDKTRIVPGQSADFVLDNPRWNRIAVEVGGANKTNGQTKQEKLGGIEKTLVAQDGIEIGAGEFVPLWLFGFLY